MQANPIKLPMHLELSQIFDFNQADLVANQGGYLTVAQIDKIHVRPYLAYGGIEYMILPLLFALFLSAGFARGWFPQEILRYFDPRIGVLIIMLIEVGILFYLQGEKVRLHPTMKVVQKIEGKPRVTAYSLQIGSKVFALTSGQQMEMRAFVRDANPNTDYQVYFVQMHRKMKPILVSIETVDHH